MNNAEQKARNDSGFDDTEIEASDLLRLLADCQDVSTSRLPQNKKLTAILDLILYSDQLGLQSRGAIFLRSGEGNTFPLLTDIALCGDTCTPVAIYNEQSSETIRSAHQDMFIYPGLDKENQISIPVVFRDTLRGVLLIYNEHPGRVSERTSLSLGLIANMISNILTNDTAESQTKNIEKDLDNQIKAMNEHAIISTLDTYHTLTEVNTNHMAISGFTEDELLGGHFCIGLSDDQDESFFEEITSTITAGNVWKGEICNRDINNNRYWTNTTIVPFLKNDTIYKYLVISTDVTETVISRLTDEEANRAAD